MRQLASYWSARRHRGSWTAKHIPSTRRLLGLEANRSHRRWRLASFNPKPKSAFSVRETQMPSLFDPIQLGATKAPNRIIMAPLTRARATREAVPRPVMAEYYAQRASAGLIISEATGISSSTGKFRSANTCNILVPTRPVAPTTATFISCFWF